MNKLISSKNPYNINSFDFLFSWAGMIIGKKNQNYVFFVTYPKIATDKFGKHYKIIVLSQVEWDKIRNAMPPIAATQKEIDDLMAHASKSGYLNEIKGEPVEKKVKRNKPFFIFKPTGFRKINFRREYSAGEYEKISYGALPRSNDDKWLIALEADTLYFHRFVPGHLIAKIQFYKTDKGYKTKNLELAIYKDEKLDQFSHAFSDREITKLIDELMVFKLLK